MIRLVRAELDLLDAALAGDDALARALGVEVAPGWISFTEALQPTRNAVAAEPDMLWGTRFFVTKDPPELVGWGGFKGPPRDGVVELGYEIAEARQGRGLATAATRAMVDEAFGDEGVTTVIAHTLAERNASNRVLEKAGFKFDGEAQKTVRLSGASVSDASTPRPAGPRIGRCRPSSRGEVGEKTGPSRKVRTPQGKGGRGTDPGKPAGKCHRNKPPKRWAPAESSAGKGEKVR